MPPRHGRWLLAAVVLALALRHLVSQLHLYEGAAYVVVEESHFECALDDSLAPLLQYRSYEQGHKQHLQRANHDSPQVPNGRPLGPNCIQDDGDSSDNGANSEDGFAADWFSVDFF